MNKSIISTCVSNAALATSDRLTQLIREFYAIRKVIVFLRPHCIFITSLQCTLQSGFADRLSVNHVIALSRNLDDSDDLP
jgi:hypothetical protein